MCESEVAKPVETLKLQQVTLTVTKISIDLKSLG